VVVVALVVATVVVAAVVVAAVVVADVDVVTSVVVAAVVVESVEAVVESDVDEPPSGPTSATATADRTPTINSAASATAGLAQRVRDVPFLPLVAKVDSSLVPQTAAAGPLVRNMRLC
jgi:hypothetical protein